MRAQAKVRDSYVVIRLTHKQLRAVEWGLGNSLTNADTRNMFDDGHEIRAAHNAYGIISRAALAVLRGQRGNQSGTGMLYDYEVTDAEKAVKASRRVRP